MPKKGVSYSPVKTFGKLEIVPMFWFLGADVKWGIFNFLILLRVKEILVFLPNLRYVVLQRGFLKIDYSQ